MSTPQVQEYWLPGYGLSRNIVLSNIQYFLGPSATVRPYTYQQQIEDLQRLSKEYERQRARQSNIPGGREPYINEPIPIGAGRRLYSLVKRQAVSCDLRALAVECEQRAQADLEQKQRSRRASWTTGSEYATCHSRKRDDDSDEGPNGGQSGRDGKSDSSTPTRGSQSSSFSQRSSQNSANPSYGGSYSWALRLTANIARRYQLVYFHH